MHQAMLTAWILAFAVFAPFGVVHESVKGLMMFIGDQVAGPLPTLDIPGRIAPCRAGQFPLTRKKFQVDG